jgi:hypothetical protein
MEKFIETIYPSQPKQTQESLEKQEKDRQQAKEERWEIFFVALSVLAAVVVCGVGMVRTHTRSDHSNMARSSLPG